MNSKEIHLKDYLKIIGKHRGMIVTLMLVTFVVSVLVTFSATPQYRSSTKVMIQKAGNNNLVDRYSNNNDSQFYDTQYQVIKSQQVARRVVALLSLENIYDSYLGQVEDTSVLQPAKLWLRQLKGEIFGLLKPENDSELIVAPQRSRTDELAEMISAGIEVSPVGRSQILTISFTSANPELAALIVNTVAKAYMETTLEMKMESTRRTIEWMSEKADQERLKLEKAEQELQSYMRSNDLITLEDRIGVIPQQLAEISTQLVQAQNKREKLEAVYTKVKQVATQPAAVESVLGLTNGETLQILRDQILKAEQYIRELSTKFGLKHPTMIKANGDLDVLLAKKAQEINRLIESVKNEYEFSVSDENNLRQQLEKTKAEAHNLNEKFIQYGAFMRERETYRQFYDALLLKIREQNITGETQPVDLWIMEQARVPRAPTKKRIKNLLLGMIVGLFGGIGLAFFVEYLDQTIKYPEEAEQALGVPVLGLVPLYKEKTGSIETVMSEQPRSAMAENYRAFRTSLFLSAAERPPSKVLITSAAAGAGKSTTSVNLAVTIAQSGKRVLLIDGDMRKPRLHKLLGLNATQGLSSYLAGVSSGDILQQTKQENLVLIASGPIPPNPSELLLSERMKTLVETMSKDFDCIICDSPPLQSVVDGRILSQLFDGTVLVVRANQTTFDLARMGLKQLQDVNTPVLGVMINALKLKKSDAYYESYYVAYGDEPESCEAGKG